MKNAKTEFSKIMGLGDIDYEFTLNLSEPEAKLYKFDIDQTKSLKDCRNLLQIEEIKDKIIISSKNNLINLLLFINKTSQNKIFVEFLSLNCLFLNQDMSFIKEKIKQDFNENFLFLIESNIMQPCKFKLNINVQNKQPKSFEMELQSLDKKIEDKKIEIKKDDKSQENPKKNEEIKKDDKKPVEVKKDDKKPEELKKDDKKPEELKKDDKKPVDPKDVKKPEEIKKDDKKPEEIKKDDKKPEEIKKDDKKPEEIKDVKKPEEVKKDEKKPEEIKKDDKKPEDYKDVKKPEEVKKDDKKPEEVKKDDKKPDLKPKQGNTNAKISINLPNISKPSYSTINEQNGVDAKDDELKIIQSGNKNNLLNQIKYQFETCDYIFIDLNKFLTYHEINLSDLYDFLYTRIIHLYINTSIILIFPSLDQNFKTELLSPLVDLITISDIVIYDKRDAQKLCTLLGYKVEEKNFEVRFMFLKELKRGKFKPQKTSLFLDDFHKLTVIMQETESNLIIFHNEFNFELGFKLDYFKTVTNNYEFLKYVFYGGFFSRVVQNKPFDVAFHVGLETFKKMLEVLHSNQAIPDDPEYFLVKNKKPEKKEKFQENKNFAFETKHSKNSQNSHEFSSNSPSNKQAYKSSNMSSSDNMDDSYGYSGVSPKSTSIGNNPSRLLEIEQKKLLTILEANEKIQLKLNKLLSGGKQLQQYSDDESNQSKFGKNLPGIKGGNSNAFSKMSKGNYKSSYERKKNLKPISKETYDRLTGNNKMNYNNDMMSNSMGGFNQKQLSQEEQFYQMQQMNQTSQKLNNQTSVKKEQSPNKVETEIKKDEKSKEIKKDENLKKDEKSQSPPKFENKNQFDMSKIDPAMLQNFFKMQQNMNPSFMNSPQMSQILKKPNSNIQRHKRELEPVCNLGFVIQQIDPQKEKELQAIEEKNRKSKKNELPDGKHNKTKFKYLEEQKKENLLEDVIKSVEERGRSEDYDDLLRSQEKAEKERKRIESERSMKDKAEKEKVEKEKKKDEKDKKEKDDKKHDDKMHDDKKYGKEDDKKVEEKKDAKKDEKKPEEIKK